MGVVLKFKALKKQILSGIGKWSSSSLFSANEV